MNCIVKIKYLFTLSDCLGRQKVCGIDVIAQSWSIDVRYTSALRYGCYTLSLRYGCYKYLTFEVWMLYLRSEVWMLHLRSEVFGVGNGIANHS